MSELETLTQLSENLLALENAGRIKPRLTYLPLSLPLSLHFCSLTEPFKTTVYKPGYKLSLQNAA